MRNKIKSLWAQMAKRVITKRERGRKIWLRIEKNFFSVLFIYNFMNTYYG